MSAHVKSLLLILPLLLAPSGLAAQDTARAPTPAAERPCTVTLPGADLSGWKEVRATGFTFCVPANWRPSGRARGGVDARTWRGGSGSITWGKGNPVREVRTVIVAVPVGSPIPEPPGHVRRFTETIGEAAAEMWDNEFDGERYTGAEWKSRSVYITGEGNGGDVASLQLRVYRTVRFTTAQ